MLDYSKFIFHSDCAAFKNDKTVNATLSIAGSVGAGGNIASTTIALNVEPDFVDLMFNGAMLDDSDNVVPSTAWRRRGYVWFKGNNPGAGMFNIPVGFEVFWHINGASVVLSLYYFQQFSEVLTLVPDDVLIEVVSYSHT